MRLPEYIFLAASSLFVIVDPLATVPAFLAMTPTDSPEQRIKMARLACFVMAGVLIFFVPAGERGFLFLCGTKTPLPTYPPAVALPVFPGIFARPDRQRDVDL